MKRILPTVQVKDLNEKAKKYVRSLIRDFCINCGLFKIANEEGIGLDETEECLEELLNKGEIKFFYNEDTQIMVLKKWDRNSEEYI